MHIDNYTPLFQLGLADGNPSVKILTPFSLTPGELSALVTVLADVVINSVEEKHQNEYEKAFFKIFKKGKNKNKRI